MKKFLLSLALVLGLSSYALADDENTSTETTTTEKPFLSVTTVIANQTSSVTSYTADSGLKSDDYTWTTTAFSNNNNASSWNNIRCGRKSNTSTASIATDFKVYALINKVTVNMCVTSANKDKLNSLTLEVSKDKDFKDVTKYTPSDTIPVTTAGDVSIPVTTPVNGCYYRLVFDCASATANGFCWVNSISYYGEAAEAPSLSAPQIELGYDNKVTLTQDEADAIYYTLDGTEPTAASTKYTEPFAITEAATVKAVAAKGDALSEVETLAVTPYTISTGFAAISALEKNAIGVVSSPMTVIYNNGSYTWLKDADGGFMLVYGTTPKALSNGDVIASLVCKNYPYNDLPEVNPVQWGEVTTGGTAIEPEELSLEELGLTDANKYVVFKDVAISNVANNQSFTITDADENTVAGYNQFYNTTSTFYTPLVLPENGSSSADIYGFVGRKSNTLQISPIKIDINIVTVGTPTFSVAAGLVDSDTSVTIASSTEGATIYYTVDGTEPTTASTKYTEPVVISKSTTIKAIAVKEGCDNSEVGSVSYYVASAASSKVTFDFSNPEGLTPSIERAKNGEGVDVTDKTFTNGDVAISFTKQDGASNGARLFSGTNDGVVTLRLYSYKSNGQATMTVGGENVSNIEYIQISSSSSFYFTTSSSSYTETSNGAYWQHALTEELVPSVKFTTKEPTSSSQTSTISAVTVVYTPAETNAVNSVAVDSENAPVEYYNLQGVRVANPTQGLFIRRQGNTVSKVVIK
jgi:hypothetical protein